MSEVPLQLTFMNCNLSWSRTAKNGDAVRQREFFIDNLLVRIHFIIEMIWWTGLSPWL